MKFLEKNISHDEPGWINRYSMLVRVDAKNEDVFELVHKDVPKTLFPTNGETAHSYTEKVKRTSNIDQRYNRFTKKSPGPINNDPRSQQPIRRTSGVCTKLVHRFETDTPAEE